MNNKKIVDIIGLCEKPDIPKTKGGVVVAVIVWQLDLQLPMQSVPITTDVVSSKLDKGEVYNIINNLIKFVSDLWQVGGIFRVLRFPPPIKLTSTNKTDLHQ